MGRNGGTLSLVSSSGVGDGQVRLQQHALLVRVDHLLHTFQHLPVRYSVGRKCTKLRKLTGTRERYQKNEQNEKNEKIQISEVFHSESDT